LVEAAVGVEPGDLKITVFQFSESAAENERGAADKDLVTDQGHRRGLVIAAQGLVYDPPIAEGRVQRPIRVVAHQAEVARSVTEQTIFPALAVPGG
jgi:hypothetical protein